MSKKRASDAELAEEARSWDSGKVTPKGWVDAPDAIPNAKESVPISLRVPAPMLLILKEYARREGVGYQVLMKRWLDERICSERDRGKRRAAKPSVPSGT